MIDKDEMILLHNILKYIDGNKEKITLSMICSHFGLINEEVDKLFMKHFEGNHVERFLHFLKLRKLSVYQCELVNKFYAKMTRMGINLSIMSPVVNYQKLSIKIQDITNFIDSQPINQINIHSVASRFHCLARDIEQIFYYDKRITFSDYVNMLRIKRCREMIRVYNVSKEVAARYCEFDSYSDFISLHNMYFPKNRECYKDDNPVSLTEEEQRFICSVVQLVHQNELKIDISTIAKNLNVSVLDLEKKFKQLVGLSLTQYINQIKITQILSKIENSEDVDLFELINRYGFSYASDFLIFFYLTYQEDFVSYIAENNLNVSTEDLAFFIAEANVEMSHIIDNAFVFIDSSEKTINFSTLSKRMGINKEILIAVFKLCSVPSLGQYMINQNKSQEDNK